MASRLSFNEHTDRVHDISLCFYYIIRPVKKGGGAKEMPFSRFSSRLYQKLEFAARRRNKAGERSAIKATLKGWLRARQINTSPKRHILTISGSSRRRLGAVENSLFQNEAT